MLVQTDPYISRELSRLMRKIISSEQALYGGPLTRAAAILICQLWASCAVQFIKVTFLPSCLPALLWLPHPPPHSHWRENQSKGGFPQVDSGHKGDIRYTQKWKRNQRTVPQTSFCLLGSQELRIPEQVAGGGGKCGPSTHTHSHARAHTAAHTAHTHVHSICTCTKRTYICTQSCTCIHTTYEHQYKWHEHTHT